LLFRPVRNAGSQAVNAAVLILLSTLGFTLPVNTDGVVFAGIVNDFNMVVLCDTAVFFRAAGRCVRAVRLAHHRYFRVVLIVPFFIQTGIELVERLFQANPSTHSGQAWKQRMPCSFLAFSLRSSSSLNIRTRLQPIMGLQFTVRRDHAAYDGTRCHRGLDVIKTRRGKLLLQLQLGDRVACQRFHADAAGLSGFDMINADAMIILLWRCCSHQLCQFSDDQGVIAFGIGLQQLTYWWGVRDSNPRPMDLRVEHS
jgi:hypothetical protein